MADLLPLSRRGLLALLPLLGARCAEGPEAPACGTAAPNPVPIAVSEYLPFVQMSVNGWPVTALLDTGAERTLVAETLLPALGLPVDPRRRAFQSGATGVTAARPIATLPRVGLGGASFRNLEVGVVDPPGMRAPDGNSPQIVLGADILALYDLDLDLPNRRVTLLPGRRCGVPNPLLPGPTYELRGRVERKRVVVPIAINGRPGEAVLDTGANVMHLPRNRAAAFGITEAMLAAAPQRRVRGINNAVENLALVTIESIGIGPETLRNVQTLVGEPLLGDMVIGTPWLGFRRMQISYADGSVRVLAPPGT